MDTLPVKKQTFDMEAGDLLSEGTAEFQIMPVPPGLCRCSANAQSLHYRCRFYEKKGRWPNWFDDMTHCMTETQYDWTNKLEGLGVDVNGGKIQP